MLLGRRADVRREFTGYMGASLDDVAVSALRPDGRPRAPRRRPLRRLRDADPLAGRCRTTTLRHEGAVVAEDQEPLARAFGQVEHQANRPARASGWATVDQVNRRFAAACAAAGLEGRRTWRESG